MTRLNDVFPDWFNGKGIFAYLNNFDVPWKNEDIFLSLDMQYHGNVSGRKNISPLLFALTEGVEIAEDQRVNIARLVYTMYSTNWGKLWDTLSFQYDPIENYSMTEQMTDDKTITEYGKIHTRKNDLNHAKTGNESRTPDLTEIQTPDLKNNSANSVYGFNSVSAVPTGELSQTSTGNNTVKNTGTDTVTYDLQESDTGSATDSDSGSDTNTRNYQLKRSGNIGVTTSQQMVQSERDLWRWNFFINEVFPALDYVLTIQVY